MTNPLMLRLTPKGLRVALALIEKDIEQIAERNDPSEGGELKLWIERRGIVRKMLGLTDE